MSWDSKLSYPLDAACRVSVKATDFQKGRWQNAARQRGMATAGAFLAWAADMFLAMQRAYEDANHEHYVALHPLEAKEDAQREEKWAQERWAQEGGR